MKKGGYKIFDLSGNTFTDGTLSSAIPGVYETLESNYNKPILVSGLKVSTTEYADFFATLTVSSGDFVLTGAGIGTITVDDDDKITVDLA